VVGLKRSVSPRALVFFFFFFFWISEPPWLFFVFNVASDSFAGASGCGGGAVLFLANYELCWVSLQIPNGSVDAKEGGSFRLGIGAAE
jgi:hypothetical protein